MKTSIAGLICFVAWLQAASVCEAGWPFFADGPKRGTPEWYAANGDEPVGARQRFLHGKMWPVSPRPCGPEQKCAHIYHAAHYWPHPYHCADRSIVRQVWATQEANGWADATTVYDYNFDPETYELNSAGQRHLEWVMTRVPEQHRRLTVAQTGRPEFDSVRLSNVQREVAAIGGANSNLPIRQIRTSPSGRPATEVDKIMDTYANGVVPPTISYSTVTGGN